MADSMDFSELDALVQDLRDVPNLANAEVKKSMQQTAMETKKSYQADAKKGSRGRQYAPTIDYEITGVGTGNRGGEINVEVGPNLGRYGGKTGKGGLVPSLGILDDPQSGIRGTPSRARRRAEKFAAEEMVKRIEIAADESLKKLGL